MSEELVCSSCEKPKNKLFAKKSRLVGSQLYMCQSCIDQGYEPRWAIILASRSFGPDFVKSYIKNRKYEGEEILAQEVFK